MKDLSIIIVNYYTEGLIIDCVKSIISNTRNLLYEVIIVDNNSPNNSFEKLSCLNKEPDFHLISLEENVGFGRANNEGLKIAKGRNILFLNPDTIVCQDAISIMCNYLDDNDSVGACCANLYDGAMNPVHSYNMIKPSLFNEINLMLLSIPSRFIYGKNLRFNYSNNCKKVNCITGADLMTRKRILDKIGGFNPTFFMYYEDTELCYRIKKEGGDLISLPNAKIMHLEGKSFNNIERRAKMSYEGRENYYKLVYPKYYRIISKMLFCTNCLAAYFVNYSLKRPVYRYWKTQFLMCFNSNYVN